MEVLYDKERAEQRKKQIDEEFAAKNHRQYIRFLLIVWGISTILASLYVFFAWPVFEYTLSFAKDSIFLQIGIGSCFFAVPVILYFAADFITKKGRARTASCEYPPDIRYLMAVEDKTILANFVSETSSGNFLLSLRLKDENDLISEEEICILDKEYSSEITEDIVNLERGLYLVPIAEKEKNIAESVQEKENNVSVGLERGCDAEKEKAEKIEEDVPEKTSNTDTLTIEQLKNLHLGDWVWIDILDPFLCDNLPGYYCKKLHRNNDKLFCCGYPVVSTEKLCFLFDYKDYRETWLAYENKQKKK